jgi:cold shock CspA family protein
MRIQQRRITSASPNASAKPVVPRFESTALYGRVQDSGAGGSFRLHQIGKVTQGEEFMIGTVIRFYNGYGFVKCDDNSPDMFLHGSNLASSGDVFLQPGTRIIFEIGEPMAGQQKRVAKKIRLYVAPKPVYVKPVPCASRADIFAEYVKSVADLNPSVPEPEKFIGSAAIEFEKRSHQNSVDFRKY